MTNILNEKIDNINFLDKCRFYFAVDKLPKTNYFIQSVNLPGLSMNSVRVPTPYSDYPVEGDKIEFEEFRMSFKVDENLNNWTELYNWMVGLVRVDDFQKRKELEAKEIIPGKKGLYSNALLLILDSNYRPFLKASFDGIFPVKLGDVSFDSRSTDFVETDVDVSFAYRRFYIERI